MKILDDTDYDLQTLVKLVQSKTYRFIQTVIVGGLFFYPLAVQLTGDL